MSNNKKNFEDFVGGRKISAINLIERIHILENAVRDLLDVLKICFYHRYLSDKDKAQARETINKYNKSFEEIYRENEILEK